MLPLRTCVAAALAPWGFMKEYSYGRGLENLQIEKCKVEFTLNRIANCKAANEPRFPAIW